MAQRPSFVYETIEDYRETVRIFLENYEREVRDLCAFVASILDHSAIGPKHKLLHTLNQKRNAVKYREERITRGEIKKIITDLLNSGNAEEGRRLSSVIASRGRQIRLLLQMDTCAHGNIRLQESEDPRIIAAPIQNCYTSGNTEGVWTVLADLEHNSLDRDFAIFDVLETPAGLFPRGECFLYKIKEQPPIYEILQIAFHSELMSFVSRVNPATTSPQKLYQCLKAIFKIDPDATSWFDERRKGILYYVIDAYVVRGPKSPHGSVDRDVSEIIKSVKSIYQEADSPFRYHRRSETSTSLKNFMKDYDRHLYHRTLDCLR